MTEHEISVYRGIFQEELQKFKELKHNEELTEAELISVRFYSVILMFEKLL